MQPVCQSRNQTQHVVPGSWNLGMGHVVKLYQLAVQHILCSSTFGITSIMGGAHVCYIDTSISVSGVAYVSSAAQLKCANAI